MIPWFNFGGSWFLFDHKSGEFTFLAIFGCSVPRPADSPGLDHGQSRSRGQGQPSSAGCTISPQHRRGQSAAAVTVQTRTISRHLFSEFWSADSPAQTAVLRTVWTFSRGESALGQQTVRPCAVFSILGCSVEGLAWSFLESPAVSLGHRHRHPAT